MGIPELLTEAAWSEFRDLKEHARDAFLVVTGVSAKPRASGWRKVREQHIFTHPRCEACGGTDALEVHHRKPFHLFPDLELDPLNLLTLCSNGPGGMNCHLIVGHCGCWKDYNPNPSDYSYLLRRMFEKRFFG